MDSIYITKEADDYLWGFVGAVKTEIGGFGFARLESDGALVWYETFIVPQTASAAEVDFDSHGGMHYAIERAAQAGVLGEDDFVWVKWHSHADMQTYWSHTDDDANEKLRVTGVPYLIDVVANRKHDIRCRLELYDNALGIPQITLDKLDVIQCAGPFSDEIESLVKQHVHKPKPLAASKWAKNKHGAPLAIGAASGWSKMDEYVAPIRSSDPGDELREALSKRFPEMGDWNELPDDAIEELGFEIVEVEDAGGETARFLMDAGQPIVEMS